MTRIALRFGRNQHLIGVIHEADNQPRPLGILLWNTGISHRIGPFRVHVDMAEKFAQLGFTVLRFDLSRLGDSDPGESDAAIQDVFTRDINDAAQVLEDQYQIKDFISVGICSGAVDAWYHARQDHRIKGMIMVDSFVYSTFWHEFKFFCRRIFSRRRWQRLFQRTLMPWTRRRTLNPVNDFLDPNYPDQAQAATDTQAMIDRRMEMLVLYTGGFHPWYSYKRQFKAMLSPVHFGKLLQLEFWPEVDHLFTLVEDRQRFLRLVQIWIQERFLKPMMAAEIAASPEALPDPMPEVEVMAHEPLAEDRDENQEIEALVMETMNSVLYPARLEAEDSFFDFGGNSILAIKTCQLLGEHFGFHVPITLLYTHLNPRRIAVALLTEGQLATPVIEALAAAPEKMPEASDEAIAIIGYACKVPGAKNVDEFWAMIREGREGLTHFRIDELDASLPESMKLHSNYVPTRGIIDGDRFDHEFFQINRREALFTDPQQRVLLETAWQALEDAGWAHRRQAARIGVYAGVGNSTYHARNLMPGHAEPHSEEEFFAQMGNDKDYVATRLAYHLDLRGPAVSVHTACSTSMVAVVEGIKTLLTDEADIVLAGAASVNAPMASGHLYQEGGIFSRDGHCRPFAADASGTLFSDGSAVVVLKRLSKAIADGDRIQAVIHGWALNNDGRDKSSFAAPSVEGQARVIRKAYERAGWSPRTVSYMECHGTATPIGDPIEIEGLRQVFQIHTRDLHFCALGSVKANIGHLTAAAGTIGLIKTALILQHGEIPPALHAYPLNPELRLQQSPFHVPKSRQSWPQNTPRRAAVSSFGVGGTNAHVLVAQGPAPRPISQVESQDPWITITWSAKDPQASQRYGELLAQRWHDQALEPRELSHTMFHKRPRFAHRQSLTGRTPKDWQQATALLKKVAAYYPEKIQPVILMFPGQGSQYQEMGRELAQTWPRFAAHFQNAVKAFTDRFDLDLSTALEGVESENGPLLNTTLYTQPALFCVEWALARSLLDCGLTTKGVLGHSIGEITAATIAGVFKFDDAVHLVYHRARLMQSALPGLMLAVRGTRDRVKSLLPPDISICVINSDESCVIGGERAAIEAILPVLKSKGLAFKPLDTSHAFHSSMMDAVLAEFRTAIDGLQLQRPTLPIISTVDGQVMTDERAMSLDYWVQQIRQPVNFLAAIRAAAAQGEALFLEVGPRDALSRFVQQILRDEGRWPSQALLPRSAANRGEELAFTSGISEIANYGIDLFVPKDARAVAAPTYPFLGEKLWLEPRMPKPRETQTAPRPIRNQPMPQPIALTGEWQRRLQNSLGQISGLAPHDITTDGSWVSLGLDSLILTQWSLKMQKEWGINMNLNLLQNELQNLQALAAHLQKLLPQETASPTAPAPLLTASAPMDATTISALLQQQMALMSRQLELISGLQSRQTEAQPLPPVSKESRPLVKVVPEPSVAAPVPITPTPSKSEPLPAFLNRLVHEGEIEFATDQGVLRMPRYRGAFLALGADGQPGLFIENPDQSGEFWQVAAE